MMPGIITSYDKKRYTYLKDNYEKIYPLINQKTFKNTSYAEILLYMISIIINLFCFVRTIIIMSRYSFLCNLITIIISYFIADIISGFVHWLPDSYDVHPFMIDTPIINTFGYILQDTFDGFKIHHIKPHYITKQDVFNTSGSTFILTALIQLIIMLILPANYVMGFIGVVGILSVLANEFHKLSHMRTINMAMWQKIIMMPRIFLTKDRHKKHHDYESELQGYTMVSGLLNPVLDHPKIRLWDRLEKLMYYLFKIKSFRMINMELDLDTTK